VTWRKTGIASTRDCNLCEVPDELWSIGGSLRAADLSGNSLCRLPPDVERLGGLMQLSLSRNLLVSEGVPWDKLAMLTQITVLALDHNRSELFSGDWHLFPIMVTFL
jgi:Leucine-rich repeat (LRR) protein